MPHEIADNIRRLMDERGIDANALAERLGYSNRAMVDHWLSGRRLPTPASIKRLSDVLGVPVSDVDPSGSAYKVSRRRLKSHGVDKSAEVGRIPYSHPPTTTKEGLMSDQIRRLEGALLQLPEEHREAFIHKVSLLGARMLLDLEEPGDMPGKRARAAGKG